ncbi:heterokaryon incompatibility protein s [Xylariaceae sp. FL1019]|nr:heterokaryon incompatibility protein s [Xylariaceae sp. FL1019]
MAEPFSVVSGALGIAALFTKCIMLDTLNLRLSRWGDAVGIYDKPYFRDSQTTDPYAQQAGAILAQIEQLFGKIEEASKRYILGKSKKELEVLKIENLDLVNRNVHNKLLDASIWYRQKCTSIVKKTKWALYDNKNFEKLVRHVTELTEQLEKVWPKDDLDPILMNMARMEIEEITDAPSLEVLSEVATDTDSLLSESAAQRLQSLETHNEVHNAYIQDNAKRRSTGT